MPNTPTRAPGSWTALLAVCLSIVIGIIAGQALVEAKSMDGVITGACAPLFTQEG